MIAIINVCHKDRDLALRLLNYITLLGGVEKHDLLLQFSQRLKRDGLTDDLEAAAKDQWASVSTMVPDTEDERGWPMSANHAWMHALLKVREKIQKPWLWLEPDCVPLEAAWLDKIEAEYSKAKMPFMGDEVVKPSHRMSGIGVYPPKVVAFLKKRRLPDMPEKEAFDSFLAQEIVPFTHFTQLIQNVWSTELGKDVPPTFPDADSLGMLDERAVLFHRCKDGTLLDRFSEYRRDSERRGESDSSRNHKPAYAGSTPAPATNSDFRYGPVLELSRLEIEFEAAQLEIERLRELIKPRREPRKRKMKPKRELSPKMKAHLAKLHASRKSKSLV